MSLWISGLYSCKPTKELEFKMAITAGLQDIDSMQITQGNPIMLTFYMFIIKELCYINSFIINIFGFTTKQP